MKPGDVFIDVKGHYSMPLFSEYDKVDDYNYYIGSVKPGDVIMVLDRKRTSQPYHRVKVMSSSLTGWTFLNRVKNYGVHINNERERK